MIKLKDVSVGEIYIYNGKIKEIWLITEVGEFVLGRRLDQPEKGLLTLGISEQSGAKFWTKPSPNKLNLLKAKYL